MDFRENRCRLVGDYILGPKIGSGSFAVVWRSRHRSLGHEVAIKEIDRKQLSNSKVNESLMKEISILFRIRHPNIISLHEAIETTDKIFLVLEYCVGGDLAGYIRHFGRVSESKARHFMRQLASGLQVLRENNLIHRDLKPQNLLLSSKDENPVLKIGDFGFARYLTPQGLADTLCGSPLYMAPEIIQNQKYDAKADLWSVGAILFQLITGKPPFEGNNQFQLFQNILNSNELQFPRKIVEELHSDCIDLCKSLLRQNPVERLTFEEFFNHKFVAETRPATVIGYSSPQNRNPAEMAEVFVDNKSPFSSDTGQQLHSEHMPYSTRKCPELVSSRPSCDKSVVKQKPLLKNDHDKKESTSGLPESVHEFMINNTDCNVRKSVECNPLNSSAQGSTKIGSMDRRLLAVATSKAADSLELIEREYVLVSSHCASTDTFCSSREASLQDVAEAMRSYTLKTTGKCIAVQTQVGESSISPVCDMEGLGSHSSVPLVVSEAVTYVGDMKCLHSSTRLQSLHQYILALSELSQEKLNKQLPLESFSVELVVLSLWKEALHVCKSWVATSVEGDMIGKSSANASPPAPASQDVDFNSPGSVCLWVEQEFINAIDRAEKISNDLHGGSVMPDAMEIIFQTALAAGKNGGVDELMGNKSSAAAGYSKAITLFSFILQEATSLSPPYPLSVSDQKRIHKYILCLKVHQSHLEIPDPSPNQGLAGK